MTLEDLIAKDAIREALARYCHLLDAQKADEWVALYTADGYWDGGSIGKFEGPEGLKGFVQSLPGIFGPRGLRHSISNVIITVEGEKANALAYLDLMQVGEGGGANLVDIASYDVDFVKDGGRWLIAAIRMTHPE